MFMIKSRGRPMIAGFHAVHVSNTRARIGTWLFARRLESNENSYLQEA